MPTASKRDETRIGEGRRRRRRNEEEEEDEEDEEEEEAAEEDGDELGGDEEDETTVGVDTFIEETTAFVENEENIGLPTIVALFTSLPLTSFVTCLLSS